MQTSEYGLHLIERFEGLRLSAYQDSVGVWTIGVGHTGPEVKPGLTISQEQAKDMLRVDVKEAERAVNTLITRMLTQNEFDALVSFTFNLGAGNLRKSTLRRLLNAGDYQGAANEFLKWDKAGGEELPGLTKRRFTERDLFLDEHYA
jgi:lysozyme